MLNAHKLFSNIHIYIYIHFIEAKKFLINLFNLFVSKYIMKRKRAMVKHKGSHTIFINGEICKFIAKVNSIIFVIRFSNRTIAIKFAAYNKIV